MHAIITENKNGIRFLFKNLLTSLFVFVLTYSIKTNRFNRDSLNNKSKDYSESSQVVHAKIFFMSA